MLKYSHVKLYHLKKQSVSFLRVKFEISSAPLSLPSPRDWWYATKTDVAPEEVKPLMIRQIIHLSYKYNFINVESSKIVAEESTSDRLCRHHSGHKDFTSEENTESELNFEDISFVTNLEFNYLVICMDWHFIFDVQQ